MLFRSDDNDICFVKYQLLYLDFHSASSLKKQSTGRHVLSLHLGTLSRFRANKSLLFLFNAACLAEKQHIQILSIFGLTRSEL